MARKQLFLLALSSVLLTSAQSAVAEAPKQWANNATCTNPASGAMFGAPFKMERADYNSTTLSLRQNQDRNAATASRLGIKFPRAIALENTRFNVAASGKAIVVLANRSQASLTDITVTKTTNGSASGPKSGSLTKNYLLTLQFYSPTKNYLPGYIDFKSLDDGSTVRGYFFAEKGAEGDSFY